MSTSRRLPLLLVIFKGGDIGYNSLRDFVKLVTKEATDINLSVWENRAHGPENIQGDEDKGLHIAVELTGKRHGRTAQHRENRKISGSPSGEATPNHFPSK